MECSICQENLTNNIVFTIVDVIILIMKNVLING